YFDARQSEKALPLVGEYVARARKQLRANEPRLARELAVAGWHLLQARHFLEAEPLLRECLLIRAQAEPDSWGTFITKSLLGGALLGQKRYADAEPLLLAGYEGMKERAAKIP